MKEVNIDNIRLIGWSNYNYSVVVDLDCISIDYNYYDIDTVNRYLFGYFSINAYQKNNYRKSMCVMVGNS